MRKLAIVVLAVVLIWITLGYLSPVVDAMTVAMFTGFINKFGNAAFLLALAIGCAVIGGIVVAGFSK